MPLPPWKIGQFQIRSNNFHYSPKPLNRNTNLKPWRPSTPHNKALLTVLVTRNIRENSSLPCGGIKQSRRHEYQRLNHPTVTCTEKTGNRTQPVPKRVKWDSKMQIHFSATIQKWGKKENTSRRFRSSASQGIHSVRHAVFAQRQVGSFQDGGHWHPIVSRKYRHLDLGKMERRQTARKEIKKVGVARHG